MTRCDKSDWDAQQDLAALLDGLTAELLTAPEHEIAACPREAAKDAAQGMRRLVAAADAHCVAPHVSSTRVAGLRALVARQQ
ncbi:MAG TPA: hypothetical protein VGL95_02420 [Acetobacteraceae bacterium]|jgi:hypothetical protein